MKAKRVFLIVLDSVGIGYAPDAADFGDAGANTMKRISASENSAFPPCFPWVLEALTV